MKESITVRWESFVFPDLNAELEEFERVGKEFAIDPTALMLLADEEGKMIPLEENVWSTLQNTDSNKFGIDKWEEVGAWSRKYDKDWVSLKEKMMKGEAVDAPIVMKKGDIYHLVSGNTRLMVARALGKTPTVLMFEYKEDRTHEESY